MAGNGAGRGVVGWAEMVFVYHYGLSLIAGAHVILCWKRKSLPFLPLSALLFIQLHKILKGMIKKYIHDG